MNASRPSSPACRLPSSRDPFPIFYSCFFLVRDSERSEESVFSFVLFLLPRNQHPQIPQIIPRRPGHYHIQKLLKISVRITVPKRLLNTQPRRITALQRFSIRHRPCRGTVSINAVRPRAQYRHLPSSDFPHAHQYKRRISSAHSRPRHRRTYFSIRDERHSSSRICRLQLHQLPHQIFRRLLHRPVIGRIVATRFKSHRLRRMMRRMK